MILNYWAIIVSAIVSIVIGSLWYGPLFGKTFMHAMGMDDWSEARKSAMRKSMLSSYVLQSLSSLVMFFVLAWYINISGHTGVLGGLDNAFWLWIGFVVPLKLGDALWGGKMVLFWLSIGNMFFTLAAAGAIIGGWQ